MTAPNPRKPSPRVRLSARQRQAMRVAALAHAVGDLDCMRRAILWVIADGLQRRVDELRREELKRDATPR